MSRADRFQNKVVIVTGAAQGIGRGVALNVAAEGGSVLAVDRSELVAGYLGQTAIKTAEVVAKAEGAV